MVTHNPELAANTDRSIHIKDGKIEKEVKNIGA
jgi:ABC-type lipoprotein export system ATPase subunit